MPGAVSLLLLITIFFQLATNSRIFQHSLDHIASHNNARDTVQGDINRAALPNFQTSSGDHTTWTFPGQSGQSVELAINLIEWS
jgi:hypothetical protein